MAARCPYRSASRRDTARALPLHLTDTVKDRKFVNYPAFEYYISAALLICAMFGMGTTLRPPDFLGVARTPHAVVLIFVMQVLATPLLAIALANGLSVPREIAVGLLLTAALPGGLFSNLLTYIGRGNVALSVAATAVSTFACIGTTTFVLKTFGSTRLPDDFSMPVTYILSDIGLYSLLPLTAGMVLRRFRPSHHALVSKYCIRASMLLLGLLILGALTAGRIQISAYGWRAPLAIILLQIFSIWLCLVPATLLRLSLPDTFTVCIEVVVRNAHLGVLLKAVLFPSGQADVIGDGVLYVVLFYGFASLVIGGIETTAIRNRLGFYRRMSSEMEPEEWLNSAA